MNGHDRDSSPEFDKRQYPGMNEHTSESRRDRFKNSKGRAKLVSTSSENGNLMPVLLEEEDNINIGISSNLDLEQSLGDMSSRELGKSKHQRTLPVEPKKKMSSQKSNKDSLVNRNTDDNNVQYVLKSRTLQSKSQETTMTSEKKSEGSGKSEGYEFPEIHDDDEFDMDDIEEEYEGNDIYVFYLMTDEGAILGPFRMDIENVEIGLPKNVEEDTADEGILGWISGGFSISFYCYSLFH